MPLWRFVFRPVRQNENGQGAPPRRGAGRPPQWVALQAIIKTKMTTQFALDLRLARRKAGLTQRDGATLLAIDPGTLSVLEAGKRLPTLTEIVTLSVIYGRSFEALFSELMATVRRALKMRIDDLTETVRPNSATRNRDATLDRLRRELSNVDEDHGA